MFLKNHQIRVNNHIESLNFNVIGKVLQIGNNDQDFEQVWCECSESFEWFFSDNYKGIPLTDKILADILKFNKTPLGGFAKEIKVTFAKQESIELSKNSDAEGLWYVGFRQGDNETTNTLHNNDFVFLRRDLKYLHELENLYFSLTGEELEVPEEIYGIYE